MHYLGHISKTSKIKELITVVVIKVCSMKRPFSKKSYNFEIGQLICEAINLLVSICCKLLLKPISEQTIVQVFFKDKLIFKKQSNIDSPKIFYHLTLPLSLISSKWKAIYWVKCYVIFFVYLVYYYAQVSLGSKILCFQ